MLNHKIQQRTFQASSITSLDQQVNDFINVLDADPEVTYIASPMQLVTGAGGYLYQTVVFQPTTPITILTINK